MGHRAPDSAVSDPAWSGCRIALIASRFNPEVCEGLVAGARRTCERAGIRSEDLAVFRVFGAFELPSAVAAAQRSGRFAAVIALGCLIRGETPHFDHIAGAVTNQLCELATRSDIVVTFGVLTTHSLEQALARAGGELEDNKGSEAAQAALEQIAVLRAIGSRQVAT